MSAFLTLGANEGQGTLTVEGTGTTLTFQSAVGSGFNIGHNGDNAVSPAAGGTGTLVVKDGAVMAMQATTGGSVFVGRGAGSNALVEVLNGGRLDITHNTANASLSIGDRVGTTSAVVRVSGTNSEIDAGFVSVGQAAFDPNSTGGNGQLRVESGGVLKATGMIVADGGIVSGNGGTIQVGTSGVVGLRGTGQIGDNGGAIQTLSIVGNLAMDGGALRFDVGAGATNNDRIDVSQAASVNNPAGGSFPELASLVINTVGGYQFVTGEQRVLVNAGAGVTIAAMDFDVTVLGQAGPFRTLSARQALARTSSSSRR